MDWFGQTFRKVHILYVSPQWARRRGQAFDANEYADMLAEAGVDCVELYTKDHHGTCYFACPVGLSYPRDIVGELLPALRERSIRLIAYVSVAFDNYALGVHPEWRAVNPLGDPHKIGPFYMACWSSPYTDFVLQQLTHTLRVTTPPQRLVLRLLAWVTTPRSSRTLLSSLILTKG